MNVWTAIEIGIYAGLAAMFLVGMYWAWYTSFRAPRRVTRGVAPGQGGVVMTWETGGGMHGGGVGGATVISRDPQLYAQGLMPADARKTK